MRNFSSPERGISLVEIIVALGLGAMLTAGAYTLFTRSMKTQYSVISNTKTEGEARKALDRIYSELINAVSLYGSKATVLGTRSPYGKCIVASTLISAPATTFDEDTQERITYAGGSYVHPNAVVALPGRDVETIDPYDSFTIVDPSLSSYEQSPSNWDDYLSWYVNGDTTPATYVVDDQPSDGLRIAYLPKDSVPTRVGSIGGKGNTTIHLVSANGLKVGDFAIISDTSTRELFRITGVSGNNIEHGTSSYWNGSFTKDFGSDAVVQRVEVVTYAHDPIAKQLLRDDHRKDDGYDSSTGVMNGGAARHTSWEVVATEVKRFRIQYSVYDKEADKTTGTFRVTRRPRGGSAAPESRIDDCKNQLGHPLFRQATIELSVGHPQGEGQTRDIVLSRSTSPEGLMRSVVSPPTYDSEKKTYPGDPTPTPVPPCGGCPTPTPAPVSNFMRGGF